VGRAGGGGGGGGWGGGGGRCLLSTGGQVYNAMALVFEGDAGGRTVSGD